MCLNKYSVHDPKQGTENRAVLTVLPKNKIHIINLGLHLGLTTFQVPGRNLLLFCNGRTESL